MLPIQYCGEEFTEKLVNCLDLRKLKDKINEEEDIVKISVCVGGIVLVNKKLAEELIPIMKNKIGEEENIVKISMCVMFFAVGNKKLAEELIPIMKNKIEEEEDVEKIGGCVRRIALGSKELASNLVSQLNPENAKTPNAKKFIINLKTQYPKI